MRCSVVSSSALFFFNDTATTEIYTLSLHDALPIFDSGGLSLKTADGMETMKTDMSGAAAVLATMSLLPALARSEEHTSELQSHSDLVCRLLLEKKKKHKQRCAAQGRTTSIAPTTSR